LNHPGVAGQFKAMPPVTMSDCVAGHPFGSEPTASRC
jgi:hypothetical protein